MASGWTITQLSASVSKLVENDTYGQYPFVYVIQGIDKVVVIDCGTGQHNLKLVLDTNLNPKKLPYLLLLTHCHFDHIGGAKDFLNAGGSVFFFGFVCFVSLCFSAQ
jgi:glyoxylase-like metal-dependent hydrolase (beta-lactamase superfamily II)